MIILNDELRYFCKLQRTGYGNVDDIIFDKSYNNDMNTDLSDIKKYITGTSLNICDIGCGIGGIDILLYKNFDISNMTLIDKNGKSNEIYYGFRDTASFYNELDLTKKMLINNGVPENIIHLININNDKLPSKERYDLILSLLSLSFHYPYNTYSDFIAETLNENGILIIDIRDNTNELDIISKHFRGYNIIKQHKKSKRFIFYK